MSAGGAIGGLVVDLGLNSAAFVANMEKAAAVTASSAAQMQGSLAEIEGTVNSVSSSFTGLIALLGAREIADWTLHAIEGAAETAHLAEAVGMTTEQLQAFQIAAEEIGISQERANSAVQRFASNLGAAIEGTGTLHSSLSLLNPALLTQMENAHGVNAALELFFKWLETIPDGALHARVSVAAFGRGMQEAGEIAKTIGGDIEKDLRVPDDVLQASKTLNGQFALMKESITNGFESGVVLAFAGNVKNSADEFKNLEKVAMLAGLIIGDVFNIGLMGARALIDILPSVSGWYSTVTEYMRKFVQDHPPPGESPMDYDAKATDKATQSTGFFAKAHQQLRSDIDYVRTALDEKNNAMGEGDLKTAKLIKDTQTETEQTRQLIQVIGQGPVAMARARAEMDALTEAQRKNIDVTSAQGKEFMDTIVAQKMAAFDLSNSSKLYKEAQTPLEQYRDRLQEIAEAQKAGGEAAQKAATLSVMAAATMAAAYLQPLSEIAGSFEQLFSKNKAFALASAAVSAALGIAKAFELPFPMNWAQAAAVAAATAVQIQKIESTNIGSGSASSVTAVHSGSSSVGSKAKGTKTVAGPTYQQAISIQLVGDTFGRAQLENLVGHLKQYQKDGGTILIQ